MAKPHSQASLYRKRAIARQEFSPLTLTAAQRSYTKAWLRKHRRPLMGVLALLFLGTILEVSIPAFMQLILKSFAALLNVTRVRAALMVLGGFLIAYLTTNYFSIKYQKTLTITFINDLRRQWVIDALRKPLHAFHSSDIGNLMAKFSYHLTLLQMGIQNAFFLFLQWVMLTVGLTIVTFFLDTTLLFVVLALIPVNIAIFLIGNRIASHYVGREQTMYSKIIRFLLKIFAEFPVTIAHHKEEQVLSDLDTLVAIDTYFRVRRDLWLKFGNTVLFVLLAAFVGGAYLLSIYYSPFALDSTEQFVTYAIVLGLSVNLLYLSLRVGLFSYPLELGLALCISERFPLHLHGRSSRERITSLGFQSPKVRLTRNGLYRKNLLYTFSRGDRVLMTGEECSGKSTLATIFTGSAPLQRGFPWVVKIDGMRMLYRHFAERRMHCYFVSPNFHTEEPILDVLLMGKSHRSATIHDLERTLVTLKKYPPLHFIFDYAKATGKKFSPNEYTFVEKGLLQAAYCLLNPPLLIAIDNLWLDLNDARMNAMIQILSRELQDTILICFAREANNLLDYDQTLALTAEVPVQESVPA